MFDIHLFEEIRLRGGYFLVSIECVQEPMVDAIGRTSLSKIHIIGRELRLIIYSRQTDHELSVTRYHEILEAMTRCSCRGSLECSGIQRR